MKNNSKEIFISCAIATFFVLCFLIAKPILTPFILALILSYFLNPLVKKMEAKYQIPRTISVLIIISLFFVLFLTILFVALPVFFKELIALLAQVPLYFELIIGDLYPKILDFANNLGFEIEHDVSELFGNGQLTDNFVNLAHNFVNNILSSTLNIINILSLIFIVPILLFYILRDWDLLVKNLEKHLPKKFSKEIKQLANNIDSTLSSYLRGQFNVCFILGTYYAFALNFSGLNFGFVIGMLTGLFSFIPYIGMMLGVIIALVVAIFQWGFEFYNYVIVAAIFISGQIVEGNFLTPKLIGGKIGIHAVWMIFGIFFFGILMGFTGVLLAVPLTAVSGTIFKHFAAKYRKKYTTNDAK